MEKEYKKIFTILFLIICIVGGIWTVTGCKNGNMSAATKTEKKIYYIHDFGMIFLQSPYNPYGANYITEELLKAAVDEAVDKSADVFISEFYGMVPLHPSSVYPMEEHVRWFEDTFGKSGLTPYYTFQKNGGDYMKSLCDETHQKNADFWISYRINDFHGMTKKEVTPEDANVTWVSRFYMEHLDERIGEPQSNCDWFQYMLDFQYDDVREYKLSLIAELIENYDIDGIMVDFLRGPALYNLSTTTSEQRQSLTLDFFKSIRGMLDAKSAKTGREYTLGAKLPMDMDSYDKLGIDVPAMEKEAGVNAFFLFDYYDARQDYEALDFVRENTENSLVNLEIGQATLWVSKPNRQHRLVTKEQYYTTAYLAYQHGADGISLFNFPGFRERAYVGKLFDPPFEIFSELKDPDFLARQPQHYFEAETENKLIHDFDLAAVSWEPGDSHSFNMDMAAPKGGWSTDGVLRLESQDVIEGLNFEVQINGTVLQPIVVEEEPYENPYPKLLGTPDKWLGYSVPKKCLKSGKNEVTVINHSDQKVKFYFIDLAIQ